MKKLSALIAATVAAGLAVVVVQPSKADLVTNVFENITVDNTIDVTGLLNATPELIRTSFSGTNGWSTLFSKTARPFRVDKVIVADGLPATGTVVVRRVRSGVTETIATVTPSGGSGSASVTTPFYVYAGDYLQCNAAGVGTSTNGTIEIHGRRF